MPVRASVGDNRCRAKRAFGGVGVCVKFGLRPATGAGDDLGFFDFRIVQFIGDGGFEVEFFDPTLWTRRGCEVFGVAAMVADQTVIAGIKTQV